MTEALWKARPIVAGRSGRARRRRWIDGETGWLVDSPAECAAAVRAILDDPARARQRGLRGKEHVRSRSSTPRLLRDCLGGVSVHAALRHDDRHAGAHVEVAFLENQIGICGAAVETARSAVPIAASVAQPASSAVTCRLFMPSSRSAVTS